MYSILIVEDHPVVVEGMMSLINESDFASVLGTASSGAECMKWLENTKPDVILLDINLPDISGVELCRKIKAIYPSLKILVLTAYKERTFVTQMLENGAHGYVLKNAMADEILEGISEVAQGNNFLCEEVDIMMKKHLSEDILLTRREKEVLKLIAEGYINNEIAEKLFISPLTVDSHRKNLLTKLNARNTAVLVKIGLDKGYI
jgi:DNA-binding NarL/FixJ family response regulator